MKLLSHTALQEKGISYSKVQIWRLIKAGRFPAAVKLGPGRNAWVETEIDRWIEERIAEREAGVAA